MPKEDVFASARARLLSELPQLKASQLPAWNAEAHTLLTFEAILLLRKEANDDSCQSTDL